MFDKIFFSYYASIIFISVGVLALRYMFKNPEKVDNSILQPTIRGYVFGISLIILGLIILIGRLTGKIDINKEPPKQKIETNEKVIISYMKVQKLLF